MPFGRAIAAAVPEDAELVVTRNPPGDRKATLFSDLLGPEDTAGVAAAQARVTPDSIAKFLFTSGSTGTPKAVINTQRMLCANQAMLAAGFAFVTDEPPVVVDWLPWSHTFGSNHNFNMVLVNGGSLYIDDGNPTPAGVPKTARNLREIAPTIYFNVPKGYEALIPHFRADETLRKTFFSRLKVLFYAGAGLNQSTWDDLTQLAIETTGERIIFLSSLGSTETSPLALACSWDFDRAGNIGLPSPGVELKLVPNEGKLEARLRGPHITPGYWRQDAAHARRLRCRGLLQDRRCAQIRRSRRPAQRPAVRRPHRRGFQAGDRHLGERRPLARALHRCICALRARRRAGGAATAMTSPRWCFPILRPAAGLPASVQMQSRTRSCRPKVRATFADLLEQARSHQCRLLDARCARAA